MANKYIIAIDLGGTNLKCALLNSAFKIKARTSFDTKSFNNKTKLILGIADSINSFIFDHNLKKTDILGVGIGLPGPLDTFGGIVHFLPNISGWKNVNIKKELQRKTGLQVFVDNDAKLMCLAESRFGAAIGYKNALCLTLGTGVGAGIIINGELFRGHDNAAGELGHLPLSQDGARCGCGSKGCLETYIGNRAIIKEARKIFGKNISLEEVSSLAASNNPAAVKIWKDIGLKLGLALSGAINLLNLDAVVIGGGVANAGRALFLSVRETIDKRSMSVQAKRVKIFKAKLGSDAGLIGAGLMVSERL